MTDSLREEIIKILKWPTIHSRTDLMHTEKIDAILSAVRAAVEGCKPKRYEACSKCTPMEKQYMEGGKDGISDFHKAIEEVLS